MRFVVHLHKSYLNSFSHALISSIRSFRRTHTLISEYIYIRIITTIFAMYTKMLCYHLSIYPSIACQKKLSRNGEMKEKKERIVKEMRRPQPNEHMQAEKCKEKPKREEKKLYRLLSIDIDDGTMRHEHERTNSLVRYICSRCAYCFLAGGIAMIECSYSECDTT